MGETERARALRYIAIMEGAFAISLLAGMSLFTEKWIPSVELGLGSPEFAALHLPRGHFGFILSEHGEMPANASVRDERLVDCDASGVSMQPPCYPGLHPLVRHIWFFTILGPIIPIIISMLAVLKKHHSDGKDSSTHLRRMCDSRTGHRHFRFLVYLAGVVFLQVFTVLKRRAEPALGIDFDPSDTITCFFGCGAIAMREVAHITLAKAPGASTVFVTCSLITCVQLYYVFWTAHFFHFPSEVFAGGALGVCFSFIFVSLTTTDRALDRVFSSNEAATHHIAAGRPLLAGAA